MNRADRSIRRQLWHLGDAHPGLHPSRRGAVLLQDTFTYSIGNLNGRACETNSGGPTQYWNVTGITLTVNGSGSLTGAGSSGQGLADLSLAGSNQTVQLTFTVPFANTWAIGVVCRYQDANNYWFLNANGYAGSLYLYQVVGGATTQIASSAFTWQQGNSYTLKLVCSGTTITGYVGSTSYVTTTSAVLETATGVGLRFYMDGGDFTTSPTANYWKATTP